MKLAYAAVLLGAVSLSGLAFDFHPRVKAPVAPAAAAGLDRSMPRECGEVLETAGADGTKLRDAYEGLLRNMFDARAREHLRQECTRRLSRRATERAAETAELPPGMGVLASPGALPGEKSR